MLTQEQKDYLAKQKVRTENKALNKGFDLRTKVMDKNGDVETEQGYFIHLDAGIQYFERPISSGNLFYLNGDEAGRIETNDEGRKVILKGEKHKEFKAPLGADEEMFERLKLAEQEAESARKELSAIKAEKLLLERERSIKNQATAQKTEAKAEKQAAQQGAQ